LGASASAIVVNSSPLALGLLGRIAAAVVVRTL
jgi:hypothetical protein